MSIIFEWKESEMQALLASCPSDEVWPLIQHHFERGSCLIEAGCGSGRWVRFLTDQGYKVVGLEYKAETVDMVHRNWSDLQVVQGDCEASPFPEGRFDGALSFGVVEHWLEGPEKPLADLYRVLKPGGKALITVPCLNKVRQWKRHVFWDEIMHAPRALAGKLIKGARKPLSRLDPRHRYAVYPAWGEFFEYRMKPEEFRAVITKAGFEIVHHTPVATFDGIYHELNPFGLLVKWQGWKFQPTSLALWLHDRMKIRPFAHAHMQAIVGRKPRMKREI